MTLLTAKQVIARTALSRSTVYQLIRDGKFPAPTRIGGASRWSEQEVTDWIIERLAERKAS